MNVVDSSGWIEYFEDSGNADYFSVPIRDVENLLVPTICVYEVFKRMYLKRGEDDALQATGFMSLGREIDLNCAIAISAARSKAIRTTRRLGSALPPARTGCAASISPIAPTRRPSASSGRPPRS